eukprot:5030889-Amphidinium_carterae.1
MASKQPPETMQRCDLEGGWHDYATPQMVRWHLVPQTHSVFHTSLGGMGPREVHLITIPSGAKCGTSPNFSEHARCC